jgi:hypothetical protein
MMTCSLKGTSKAMQFSGRGLWKLAVGGGEVRRFVQLTIGLQAHIVNIHQMTPAIISHSSFSKEQTVTPTRYLVNYLHLLHATYRYTGTKLKNNPSSESGILF